MALAPLGFQIDTSGAAKAVADLSTMTAATGKAEAAAKELSVNVNLAVNVINKITASTTQAVAATDKMTASIRRQASAVTGLMAAETRNTASHYAERTADIAAYGMEMDRLRAKYDPLFAAQQRHVAAIEEINRANQVGAISATTAMQARIRETSAYQAQISVLHNLAAAQKASAQAAVDRVTVTPDRTADIAAYGAELDRLRAKFNPVFALSKRYEAELNELNRAHRVGAITAAEHGTALLALNDRYRQTADGAQVMGKSNAMAQQQMRNLAFQFQDIGTMLAMGQSPFMLLAQQLPQVTMYGGRLTGVMGALKSTVTGLFSPLGFLTTAFVLAGSAAVSYFSDAADGGADAEDTLQRQNDLLSEMSDRYDAVRKALDALNSRIDRGRPNRDLGQVQDEMEQARQASAAALKDMLELSTVTTAVLDTRKFGTIDAFMQFRQEVRGLADDMVNHRISFDEFQAGLNEIIVNAPNDEIADMARQIRNSANVAEDETRTFERLAAVFGELQESAKGAGSEIKRAVALASLRGQLQGGLTAVTRNGQGYLTSDADRRINDAFGIFTDDPPEQRTARRSRKTDAERAAERYDDMIRSSKQYIEMQRLERDALFMSEEAASALLLKQELLNQAANDNIDLTALSADGERTRGEVLRDLAEDMAAAEAASIKLKEAYDLTKDAAKGVLSSLRQDLMDGDLSFRSFGDSVLSVLDRIIGKLEDEVATAFANAFTPGAPRGGGLFGSILGGLFGGGGSAFDIGNFYAKGGAFDWTGEITAFAKGGVVDRATVFPFAKGIGLMGEAGPEAIMPLKRGPDGSLGVRAQPAPPANSKGGGQTVKVEQHFHISGAVSSEEIKAAIREQAARTKADIEGSFAKTFEKNRKAGTV